MVTIPIAFKAAAILVSLFMAGFFFFKRTKTNKKPDVLFKHNVSLMREEKLLMHTDTKLQKKRQQLLKRIKFSEDVNQKQLITKSKKLGLPTGEILLAARIQMNCR